MRPIQFFVFFFLITKSYLNDKKVVLFLRGQEEGYREREYLMGSFTICQVLYIQLLKSNTKEFLLSRAQLRKLSSFNYAEEKLLANTQWDLNLDLSGFKVFQTTIANYRAPSHYLLSHQQHQSRMICPWFVHLNYQCHVQLLLKLKFVSEKSF